MFLTPPRAPASTVAIAGVDGDPTLRVTLASAAGEALTATVANGDGLTVVWSDDCMGACSDADGTEAARANADAETCVITAKVGDGGPAPDAKLANPRGLYVAANGDVFIADSGNHVIGAVDAATGDISTAHHRAANVLTKHVRRGILHA